jgi:hypothetical protein
MSDVTYQKFVKRWEEVTDIPPQTLGPLTGVYKQLTKRLKVMPWPWFVIAGIGFVLMLYVLIGSTITMLTTILQNSF